MIFFTPPTSADEARDEIETSIQMESAGRIKEYLQNANLYKLTSPTRFINQQEFSNIVNRLNEKSSFISNTNEIMELDEFQTLVKKGSTYLPMLLDFMKSYPYLIWVLNEVTGLRLTENGASLEEAVKMWEQWALDQGFISNNPV